MITTSSLLCENQNCTMLNRFFGKNTHLYLHLLGLCGIAFGIPLNKVVMSISMMFIVLNLLLEANFKSYWINLKKNKIYHLILGFFLLHILGLLWSSNMDFAVHDLNGKLPLLVIPTILAAKPITNKSHLNIILSVFSGTVILLTIINVALYNQWIGQVEYDDIRGLSHFSSHVRFAIIISMVIAVLLHQLKTSKRKIILLLLIVWLILYTLYSQVISGLITTTVVFLIYWIHWFYKKNKVIALLPILILAGSLVSLFLWLFQPNHFDYSTIDFNERTKRGNLYKHDSSIFSAETNLPLLLYICEEELSSDWEKYSSVPIDSTDKKGQAIIGTIIRYLASMELRKDAFGLSKLNKQDIANIENGETSAYHQGLIGRLYGVKYQLINNSNPNGHSLLERLEYWRTGFQIASDNLLFGVGTGDVQDAFNAQYEKNKTLLDKNNRHRSHNYYLTVLITFGVFGLLYFLFVFYSFIRFNLKNQDILAIAFISIILASFLIEDTIETQTGVTFFALFFALFSFHSERENNTKE